MTRIKMPTTRAPTTKGRLIVFTLAILTLFSVSWLLSKNLIGSIPAMHAVGLRLAATTATLWLIAALIERKAMVRVSLGAVGPQLFLLSVLGFSLYFIGSFGALKTLRASDLTMVLAAIPGMTYLLGLLSRSVDFSWIKTFGVAFVSVAALSFNASGDGQVVHFYGVVLAFIAAVSYALYGLLSRRYLQDLPLLTSLAWITLMGSVCFIPLFVFDPAPLLSLSLSDVIKVTGLGAVCSAPVYVLYQKVLAEGGVVYANAIGLLAPIAVVMGEWLIGTGVALSGVKAGALVGAMVGTTLLFLDASAPTGRALKQH